MDGATPDVARHWDRDYTLDGSGISPSPHVATVICLSDRAPAGAAQRVCLAALGSTALWPCSPRRDPTIRDALRTPEERLRENRELKYLSRMLQDENASSMQNVPEETPKPEK